MEIKKAAIRIGNKIFTGFDHGECFNQIPQELRNQSVEQGFVTDSNEFVDRKEAMIIARQANQIAYDDGEKKTLISEDLYLNWLNKMNKELEKLKQKSIVPKFERQSRVYGFAYGLIKPYIVVAYVSNSITLCEDCLSNNFEFCDNNYLVSTREEAEQRLAEIGGKDEEDIEK